MKELSGNLIRFYYGTDIIGNEIGVAAKNVIGLAAGLLDGLNYSSLKGALMARGTHEVSRLIEAMGGNPFSAYGLCYLETAKAVHLMTQKYGIEMPICEAVYSILYENADPQVKINELFERSLKSEF